MPIDNNHAFLPPGSGDSRSPCPAMNSLANHGYLPHDGRSITQAQLRAALEGVFNVSHGVAAVFALLALVLWGHKKPGFTLCRVVDLHELARHNVVEHDGSLVHDDAPNPKDRYAPTAVNHAFVQQLLDAAPTGHNSLTLEELCRAHVQRMMPGASRPMNNLHRLFAKAEMALIFHAMGVLTTRAGNIHQQDEQSREEDTGARWDAADGDSGKQVRGPGGGSGLVMPKKFLEQWLGEERLPDGWERPSIQLDRVVLHNRVQEIGKLEDAIWREVRSE